MDTPLLLWLPVVSRVATLGGEPATTLVEGPFRHSVHQFYIPNLGLASFGAVAGFLPVQGVPFPYVTDNHNRIHSLALLV